MKIEIFILKFKKIPSESIGGLYYILKDEIFGKPKEFSKILVPAFLYTVQNNLLFLALTNLDAATYQVNIIDLFFSNGFLNSLKSFST